MISRRSLFAVPFLSLLTFNQKEVEERYLINYSAKKNSDDEFGKIYRRVLHADECNKLYVRTAKLLKDLSLEVNEWNCTFDSYKTYRIEKNKWCIDVYDAHANLLRKLTSDTFVS